MDSTEKPRRNLDMNKLLFSQKNISSKQALRDVVPIRWNNCIQVGNEKAIITAKSPQR